MNRIKSRWSRTNCFKAEVRRQGSRRSFLKRKKQEYWQSVRSTKSVRDCERPSVETHSMKKNSPCSQLEDRLLGYSIMSFSSSASCLKVKVVDVSATKTPLESLLFTDCMEVPQPLLVVWLKYLSTITRWNEIRTDSWSARSIDWQIYGWVETSTYPIELASLNGLNQPVSAMRWQEHESSLDISDSCSWIAVEHGLELPKGATTRVLKFFVLLFLATWRHRERVCSQRNRKANIVLCALSPL